MSLSQQIEAYSDCFDTFEAAPTRVEFATFGEARIFQMRMSQARSLQRKEHRRIYETDDIRWGKSEYDKYVIRYPKEDAVGHWWVYVETHGSNILSREPLGDTADAT